MSLGGCVSMDIEASPRCWLTLQGWRIRRAGYWSVFVGFSPALGYPSFQAAVAIPRCRAVWAEYLSQGSGILGVISTLHHGSGHAVGFAGTLEQGFIHGVGLGVADMKPVGIHRRAFARQLSAVKLALGRQLKASGFSNVLAFLVRPGRHSQGQGFKVAILQGPATFKPSIQSSQSIQQLGQLLAFAGVISQNGSLSVILGTSAISDIARHMNRRLQGGAIPAGIA